MKKRFPKFLYILLLAAMIPQAVQCLTGNAMAEELPLEQLTTKMQETYDKTQDLTASFVQELTIRSIQKTEREEGTVYFKNPRRMHWDYTRPQSKKLIVNPQKSWLYVPEDRVVYVQTADSIYRSKLVLRFLSGVGQLQEDFQIAYAAPEATDKGGHYLLSLVAKGPELGIDRLNLTVDRNSFQIRQCSFSDAYGNPTRIRFANIRTNSQLPESLFQFKPPRGVEIVNVAP
jgi:outer membrane lipoprotein carrier protein